MMVQIKCFFFFSSRRRHTRWNCDWSSDVCSSDLRDLRQAVEGLLRHGIAAANGFAVQPGLSDAEIALCFEYSAGDSPIDLEKLLPRSKSPGPAAGKRTPLPRGARN